MSGKQQRAAVPNSKSSRQRCSAGSRAPLSAAAHYALALRSHFVRLSLPYLLGSHVIVPAAPLPPPLPTGTLLFRPMAPAHLRRMSSPGFLLHLLRRIVSAPAPWQTCAHAQFSAAALNRNAVLKDARGIPTVPLGQIQSSRASYRQASGIAVHAHPLLRLSTPPPQALRRVVPRPSALTRKACRDSCSFAAALRLQRNRASNAPCLKARHHPLPATRPPPSASSHCTPGHPRAHAALSWLLLHGGAGCASVACRNPDAHARAVQLAERGVQMQCHHSRLDGSSYCLCKCSARRPYTILCDPVRSHTFLLGAL